MIQLKWFRIATGADGSILSCQEVEAKGRNGAVVRYYESVNADKACRAAKEWWERRKEDSRRRSNDRVSTLKDKGLCIRCGRVPMRKGRITCEPCGKKDVQCTQNSRKGLTRSIGYGSAERAHAASKDVVHRSQMARGGTIGCWLRTQLARFDALGPIAFRARLVYEINKRSDAAHQIPTEEAQAAE